MTATTDPTSVEHVGLGAAFLQAGVGTYVAALFPLSDIGSYKLVPRMYELHLAEGRSWADALRGAQLEMIRQDPGATDPNGIPLSHPCHWAAFTVSGKAR